MKLGTLKAAIRATKGNPVIYTPICGGPVMALALQKAALLEELDKAYPGGKAVETKLTFDEKTGILSAEGGIVQAMTVSELTKYQVEPGGPLLDIMEDAHHNLLVDDDQTAPATTLDDLFV